MQEAAVSTSSPLKDIFCDRRQSRPLPRKAQLPCRRRVEEDGQPWWLKVNYVVRHLTVYEGAVRHRNHQLQQPLILCEE